MFDTLKEGEIRKALSLILVDKFHTWQEQTNNMNHYQGRLKSDPDGTMTAMGYKVDLGGVEISWNSATVRLSQPYKCAKNTEVYVTLRKWIVGYVNSSSIQLP